MDRYLLTSEILKTFENINSENILNKLNLSFKGENAILMLLNEYGGRSTPSKLLERLDFTAARLSAIIKSLENKGFVEKIQNESDKRSTIVALTENGFKHFSKLREDIVRNASIVIEQLGENDVCEFLRIIKRLVDIASTENME
ncbi:MAG: winged helix DNA-binding protein [Clostridia bacterium]|nr:winged helix DNA-binding protein [Clostridia bacterium]